MHKQGNVWIINVEGPKPKPSPKVVVIPANKEAWNETYSDPNQEKK